jgi:hypothetical protein
MELARALELAQVSDEGAWESAWELALEMA